MNDGDDANEEQASRLLALLNVVANLAAGDFSARGMVSDRRDDIDALSAGINSLAEEVEAKFAENARLLETLERHVEAMTSQHRTIMSLSTPSVLVWQGIIALPLIGILDEARAQNLSAELLQRISAHGIEVVIIDVTGIATVDPTTARHLLDTFTAARLLGAQCILTGLSAANARNMVDLDLNVNTVAVRGTLHEGLRHAFRLTGREVSERKIHEGARSNKGSMK